MSTCGGSNSESADLLTAATQWQDEGIDVAIATVIETWGSSPRPVGSELIIGSNGQMLGSVSGGCIENAVMHEAKEVLDSGKPKTLEFGIDNERAWEVGLACGGRVRVFVERLE